ncbi:hypothetical protein A2U01_0093815, partial [Trifolium medium]|nr:hypothetical protein [Trifolium medium]
FAPEIWGCFEFVWLSIVKVKNTRRGG